MRVVRRWWSDWGKPAGVALASCCPRPARVRFAASLPLNCAVPRADLCHHPSTRAAARLLPACHKRATLPSQFSLLRTRACHRPRVMRAFAAQHSLRLPVSRPQKPACAVAPTPQPTCNLHRTCALDRSAVARVDRSLASPFAGVSAPALLQSSCPRVAAPACLPKPPLHAAGPCCRRRRHRHQRYYTPRRQLSTTCLPPAATYRRARPPASAPIERRPSSGRAAAAEPLLPPLPPLHLRHLFRGTLPSSHRGPLFCGPPASPI